MATSDSKLLDVVAHEIYSAIDFLVMIRMVSMKSLVMHLIFKKEKKNSIQINIGNGILNVDVIGIG